ncbi:crosslink repair DNA glycosylase YcaQ family protein [Nonomuraea sp. NPDC048916]|uniref:DNA glycosylase AlkZ-like family protein n=1 Tax=Nonomuraea sp. NPDC048916 TaxID=3154232 RepID=UPI0033C964E9
MRPLVQVVTERMTLELVRFRDEDGRTYYDLPDAPRPSEEISAPVRLMYDFDNLFLSHADRSRVITEAGVAAMSGFMRRRRLPRPLRHMTPPGAAGAGTPGGPPEGACPATIW